MQNGFVQFQLPVWDFDNFDINKVIAMEAERHNLRDKAFEIDSLLPYHQDQKKVFTVFHSPGEQAPHILYQQTMVQICIAHGLKHPKENYSNKSRMSLG